MSYLNTRVNFLSTIMTKKSNKPGFHSKALQILALKMNHSDMGEKDIV